MEILSKLFQSKQKNVPKEYQGMISLNLFLNQLLSNDKYIARSDYQKIRKYQNTIHHFDVLSESKMLKEYCHKYDIKEKELKKIIDTYKNIEDIVSKHNNDFLKEHLKKDKKYLDGILKDVDPDILLDDKQREVVLSDEDYSLVIAGAGAGKTTTVAAKAKYLVEKKGIKPNEILIVSFTNKAVNELRERINRDLKLDCIISTFHSIGYAIISSKNPEKLNIIDSDRLYFVLSDYFKSTVLNDERMVSKLILFFSSYLSAPKGEKLEEFLNKLAKDQCTTLKSDIENYQNDIKDIAGRRNVTIQNEILRSYQEVKIANFLYLNGIDYEYEPIYPYNIRLSNKPYTPDFIIRQGDKTAYIEHFGINEDGTNFRFTDKELVKYKKAIKDKIKIHKEHNTKLLYTFSGYKDRSDLLNHLKIQLTDAGFECKPLNEKDVLEKIVKNDSNRYIFKLVNLLCRFIGNLKTNGSGIEEFERLYSATENVRDRLFLDIAKECYLEYERYLKVNKAIDFEDMINNSAKILADMKNDEKKLRFKYAIIDEYQDISKQRFDLVSAMKSVTNAKIIAVGDDWQSIYAFSGSNIKLFTDFESKVGYADMRKIEMTYRNSQEIIDIAGKFIQKNETQIKKTLKSPKHINDPILIFTYDSTYKKQRENNKSGAAYHLASAVENALDTMHLYENKDKKKCGKILLIGRFNYDKNILEKSGKFEIDPRGPKIRSVKYPKDDITFMTAHSSKGLGFDNVIIINGINGTFGFPSKIENDPVLSMVINEDRSYDFAEERRLFYVALTRTKNRVYLVAPQKNPSEFLLEIKKENENVKLIGDWNETPLKFISKDTCPICGYPMQYKYNQFGLRLYICMNEPEVCGFMSNNLKGGKMQIMKCDACQDGYLIIKKDGEKSPFLGCTNFKADKTGCNNVVSMQKYYEKFDYDFMPMEEEKSKPENKDFTIIPDKEFNAGKMKESVIKKEDLKELGDQCLIILSCVQNVSQKKYYGTYSILNLLKGRELKDKKGIDYSLLPEFGKLKDVSWTQLKAECLWLIDNHYLYLTKGMYPVLHPTNNGAKFKETITVGQLKKLQIYIEEYKKEEKDEKND